MTTHYFDTTGEAYDACQCDEKVKDGDTLVVLSEEVVGIADTWPYAITVNHGDLHQAKAVDPDLDPARLEAAIGRALVCGFELAPLFRILPSEAKAPVREALPASIQAEMQLWRAGIVSFPQNYNNYHAARARLSLSKHATAKQFTVHNTFEACDGWGYGFRPVHAIIELPNGELKKIKWCESGAWFEATQGGGWSRTEWE